MTAKQILETLRSGLEIDTRLLGQVAREAADDRELTALLFRDLVEPLSDSFDPQAVAQYVVTFSEIAAELAPKLSASELRQRYARINNPKQASAVSRVYVLSRVTLGADIAVTSVLMDAAKRAFPGARIVFVGNRKNAELWAADPRIDFLEAPYARAGTLRSRIDASLRLQGLLERDAIVIDPDSRLTQLGLIPVCDERGYYFFESRAAGSPDSDDSLAQLASAWAQQNLGAVDARPYVSPRPIEAEPRVTVSFGVGENPAKRVSEAFEIAVLQHVVRVGAKVLVDQGAGGEEAERVKHAVRQTAGLPGQVEMFSGPFATFAAHIARSPLYIGYDSAGQHAAAALGVPSITAFAGYPNERFLQRWKPSGPSSHVVLAGDGDLMERVCAKISDRLVHSALP